MPEFDFYANKRDLLNLFHFLFEIECRIIPEKQRYSDNKYQILNKIDSIEIISNQLNPFFLIHKSFTLVPLKMVESKLGNPQYYFISQRHGGPYIDLLCTTKFIENEKEAIAVSRIMYYDTYYEIGTEAEVPAPKNLKNLFYEIRKFIKSSNLVIDAFNKKYYIMAGIKEDLKNGLRLVEFEEKYYRHLFD